MLKSFLLGGNLHKNLGPFSFCHWNLGGLPTDNFLKKTYFKLIFLRMTLAYGVVVSMFDFHRSDRGSNPGRGGKISQCLRLHYSAAPLASV